MIKRYLYKLKVKLGIIKSYRSETAKVRSIVLPYCVGYGCDIGFGGDKIQKDAVGIDLPSPYAHVGSDTIDIACDVIKNSIPLEDNTFEYVYTSHLIEDYEDTIKGLNEFIRILKSEGNLILVFPDQVKYEAYSRKYGLPVNLYHKHKDMSLKFMEDVLRKTNIKDYKILKAMDQVIDYNVILIAKIFK